MADQQYKRMPACRLPNEGKGPFSREQANAIIEQTGVECKIKGEKGKERSVDLKLKRPGLFLFSNHKNKQKIKNEKTKFFFVFKPLPPLPPPSTHPSAVPHSHPSLPIVGDMRRSRPLISATRYIRAHPGPARAPAGPLPPRRHLHLGSSRGPRAP